MKSTIRRMAIRVTTKPQATWDDARLVKECCLGNEEAWSARIEKYKALIYSIPMEYRLSQHDASDVFQATCSRAARSIDGFAQAARSAEMLMQVAYHIMSATDGSVPRSDW